LNDLLTDAVILVKTSERGKKYSSDIFSRYFPFKRKQKIWKSSARHKEHGNYSMNDIAALDPELAAEIAIAGRFFGYSFRPAGDSHSAFGMSSIQSEGALSEISLAGSKRVPYECP
jgi:hypothetical protein